jgi:hypothetical protein
MLHFVKERDKGEKKKKKGKQTRLSLEPGEEEHVADVNIKH